MSAERFKIVETNPNDTTGGGGCLCGETKVTGCNGPYAVFYVPEMSSNLSPVAVIGANCLRKAAAALDGEVLAGGEKNEYIEADAEEIEELEEVAEVTNEDAVPTL